MAAETEDRLELVEGKVQRMAPPGLDHGFVTGDLHTLLGAHLRERRLGRIAAAETGFRLRPTADPEAAPSVRGADIAVVLNERLPAERQTAFGTVVPHLVVETLSPGDRATAVSRKMRWWFSVGVSEVWHLDPGSRTLTRHHGDGHARVFGEQEEFCGSEVLPDLRFGLAEVFDPG